MVEHEAHHRGQLHLMAGMRGLDVPPLYGLTEGAGAGTLLARG